MPNTEMLKDYVKLPEAERAKLLDDPEYGPMLKDFEAMPAIERQKVLGIREPGILETVGEAGKKGLDVLLHAGKYAKEGLESDATLGQRAAGAIGGGIVGGPAGVVGGALYPRELGRAGRTAVEKVGPIGGALAGAAATPATPNIGASIGAMAAETVNEGLRLAFDEEERSLNERMSNIATTGALTLAGGKAGEYLFKGIGALAAPMASKVTATGRRLMQRFPGIVRPAQATTSRVLDWLDQIAGSSVVGGGVIEQSTQAQKAAIGNAADDFVNLFGQMADPENQARAVILTLKQSDKIWRSTGNGLYAKIDKLAPTKTMDLTPIKLWAQKELRQYGPTAKAVGGSGAQMLEGILKEPTKVGFAYANQMRSMLSRASTPGVPAARDPLKAVAATAANKLTEIMDYTATKIGKSFAHNNIILNAINQARAHWKGGSAVFNNQLIRSLLVKGRPDPERVIDFFVKPYAIDNVKLLRSALGGTNSPAWRKAQQLFVHGAFRKGFQPATNAIDGNLTQQYLFNMGKNTVDEMISPMGAKALRELVEDIAALQNKSGRTGSLFIQMKQAGAITDAAGVVFGLTGNLPAAAGFIFGPAAIAKVFTNPTAVKWLTVGMRNPLGSEEASRAAGWMLNFLKNNNDTSYGQKDFGTWNINPATVGTPPPPPPGTTSMGNKPTGAQAVAMAERKKRDLGMIKPTRASKAATFGLASMLGVGTAEAHEPELWAREMKSPAIYEAIEKHAANNAIDPALMASLAKVESNYRSRVFGDRGKALGLFQLWPAVRDGYMRKGADPGDPDANAEAAGRFLKHLMKKYKGDREAVIDAFHLGETQYDKGKRDPAYVRRVMKTFNRYAGRQ